MNAIRFFSHSIKFFLLLSFKDFLVFAQISNISKICEGCYTAYSK